MEWKHNRNVPYGGYGGDMEAMQFYESHACFSEPHMCFVSRARML